MHWLLWHLSVSVSFVGSHVHTCTLTCPCPFVRTLTHSSHLYTLMRTQTCHSHAPYVASGFVHSMPTRHSGILGIVISGFKRITIGAWPQSLTPNRLASCIATTRTTRDHSMWLHRIGERRPQGDEFAQHY